MLLVDWPGVRVPVKLNRSAVWPEAQEGSGVPAAQPEPSVGDPCTVK